MCTTCLPSSDRSKGSLDFLELELRMVEPPPECWDLNPGLCKSSKCSQLPSHLSRSITEFLIAEDILFFFFPWTFWTFGVKECNATNKQRLIYLGFFTQSRRRNTAWGIPVSTGQGHGGRRRENTLSTHGRTEGETVAKALGIKSRRLRMRRGRC